MMAAALSFFAASLLPLLATAQSVASVPGAPQQVLSQPLQFSGYGIHEPHGLAAVQYLYGNEGTWRAFTGLENVYGYYNVPDSEKAQLIAYANGNNPATCADPDNNVLFQLASGSGSASGSAFMEHNGRGAGGVADGQPFSQFWYDDNWLARYMSAAYGAPQSDGLYSSPGRWQILGLDTNGWPQPDGSAPDQQALMGLYYIAGGDLSSALDEWNGILSQAGSNYDSNNQRYTYDGLNQNYYLGLFKILTDRLMDAGVDGGTQAKLFQHSMSLRSMIRNDQQTENGAYIGWCTDRNDDTSLINTESTAIPVLGLGAGARYSFEADSAPMAQVSGFFQRPYGALSAVTGLSPAGTMVYGPYMTLPTGSYTVDFYMRSGSPGTSLTVHLDVHDAQADQVLGTNDVSAAQLPGSNEWGRYSIGFSVNNAANQMEFRVTWGGQSDLDLGAIRVR